MDMTYHRHVQKETPNQHLGECTYYQALRKKVFGEEKKSVINKYKRTDKVFAAGCKLVKYGQ